MKEKEVEEKMVKKGERKETGEGSREEKSREIER